MALKQNWFHNNWKQKKNFYLIAKFSLFFVSFSLASISKSTECVQVSVVADSVNISGQSNIIQFKVPECKLSEDLGNLFDNEKFSDVTLSVGGREFQAHKAILAGKLFIDWHIYIDFIY